MYGALWRRLPGPWPVRLLICLGLALILVGVCFQWLFPWVADRLPLNDATVARPAATAPIVASTPLSGAARR